MRMRRCCGESTKKEAAERPEGLAAQRLLRFLIDDDDLAARLDKFGRRDQPGKTGAHDDDIGIHAASLP